MQKSILNFSENVLSREEMKQIKGGITCTVRLSVALAGEQQTNLNSLTQTGSCSGSTLDQCNSYAASQCSSYVSGGGWSSCSYQCY